METMREAWTDGRLDDLNNKVGEMKREMHAEFRAVRGEMRTMQATMIGGFATLFATMVGLLATQL
jgi:hypothetical protein